MTATKMKKFLENVYANQIDVSSGSALHFNKDIKQKINEINIAVYIHKERALVAVWDIDHRRKENSTSHCLSIENNYLRKLTVVNGEIKCVYKKLKTNLGYSYEKVLVMGYKTLLTNALVLYDLLEFDPDDDGIPREYETLSRRGRHSTSMWNRGVDFRKRVLQSYGYQCAVCRCKEEKLLEAAHIKAVADGGTDETSNGICLCRNHHKMMDEGLIQLDLENRKLVDIKDTVSNMPWYGEFQKRYKGIILGRE